MERNFVFVSGAHKSGTSWLAHMVGAHPLVSLSRQELWLFGHPRSIGARSAAMVQSWLGLPTVSAAFSPGQIQRSAIKAITRGAVSAALQASLGGRFDNRFVGDKTPLFYTLAAPQIHYFFPDAYFIHISRDPRDVIVSHHFQAYRLEKWSFFGDPERAKSVKQVIGKGGDVSDTLLDEVAATRLSKSWARVQNASVKASALFGDRYIGCRFEDMLEDGMGGMSKIFTMLGAPLDTLQTRKIVEQHSFANMAKGRKPGDADPDSFYRKGIVGDWKNYFSTQMSQIVAENCGEEATQFGYACVQGPAATA